MENRFDKLVDAALPYFFGVGILGAIALLISVVGRLIYQFVSGMFG